ncbi:MAG TPA: LacI family DNA-binding transcriptional regulator [Aggregatilineales bacterium]|nr:LacI family DNA-binding transcriptional regulator [Aggregatilineales bacterium]
MNGRKRLNLEDIAEKAGVSRSTVSRVVNNDPNVNEKTRAHVLMIIERERYTPNPAARIMVTKRTNVIGVVFPHTFQQFFNDPYYFPALLDGVNSTAHKQDYGMLLWVRHGGEDEGIFYRRILQNRLMDGVLIASATTDTHLIQQLLDTNTPLAMVERPIAYEDRINYMTIDNGVAMHKVVAHLVKRGRRRIGVLAGAMDNMDGKERLVGFFEALKEHGLPYDPDLVAYGEFSRTRAREATRHLLRRPGVRDRMDALVSCSDIMALGAYEAFEEAGVNIPEEIAVVGFDDLPTATQLKPMLTTIRQPIRQKGESATRMLIEQIETGRAERHHDILSTELIVRDSCGKRRTAKH